MQPYCVERHATNTAIGNINVRSLCQAGARVADALDADETQFRVATFAIRYEATVIVVADTISVHAVVIRP